MGELIRLVVRGVQGIGMADELYSLCHTNPPKEIPHVLSHREAVIADAQALSIDWMVSCNDIHAACNDEEVKVHV